MAGDPAAPCPGCPDVPAHVRHWHCPACHVTVPGNWELYVDHAWFWCRPPRSRQGSRHRRTR